MPINFEPAAPAATNASVGYGQAEQFARDLPAEAGLYESAARLSQQGQLAGLHEQVASQQAAAQGQLQDQHQQLQGRQAGEQTALAYAALHQRFAENDQHAQNQAWLMQQDLSAKELLQMRQQENAVGEVMANPKLDDQTKNDLVTQIRTHLDPAKARYEQSQARHRAQEDQLLDQKTRAMAAHQATFEQMALDMAEKGVSIRMLPDGKGGWHGPFGYNQRTGELYKIGVEHPDAAGGGKDNSFKQESDVRREWQTAHKVATDQVSAWAKETVKDDQGKVTRLYKNLEQTADFDAAVNRLMTQRGYGADLNGYVNARLRKPGGQDAGAGGDYSGGQGQGPPPAGPTPEQVAARKEQVARENPPFEDPAKATPLQRGVLKGFADTTRRMDVLALPEGEAPAARKAMDRAAALVRQYGSFEKMPEADQKFFLEVGEMVKRIDAQVATAEQEKQKFIARQGNRLERGSAALGIPVNPKVR